MRAPTPAVLAVNLNVCLDLASGANNLLIRVSNKHDRGFKRGFKASPVHSCILQFVVSHPIVNFDLEFIIL